MICLSLKFLRIVGAVLFLGNISRSWAIWGSVAVLAPVLAAALMVFKPTR